MRVGDRVSWAWGAHRAEGKITQRFTRPVTRTLKGTRVVREATPAEPAYLIRQDDGDRVLKSESELTKIVH